MKIPIFIVTWRPPTSPPSRPGLADEILEVPLERVPGRRIPLGLEWQDAAKHNCKARADGAWGWGGMDQDGEAMGYYMLLLICNFDG